MPYEHRAVYYGGMTTTHAPARLTNVELGKVLGLDHSSISRLRRGERGASIDVMLRIEDLWRWTVRDQRAALKSGTYGLKFEANAAEWASTRPAEHGAPVGLDR